MLLDYQEHSNSDGSNPYLREEVLRRMKRKYEEVHRRVTARTHESDV